MKKKLLSILTLSTSLLANSFIEDIKNSRINLDSSYEGNLSKVMGNYIQLNDFDINLYLNTKYNNMYSSKINISLEADYYLSDDIGYNNDTRLRLEEAYILRKDKYIDVAVGRVYIKGPFSHKKQGNGSFGYIKPMENLKLFGAYYHTNNIKGKKEHKIAQAALFSKIHAFDYEIWFMKRGMDIDYINFNTKADIGIFNFNYMHSRMTENKKNFTKSFTHAPTSYIDIFKINTNLNVYKVDLSFARTGSSINSHLLDKDSDSKANFKLWQADTLNKPKADLFVVDLYTKLYPKLLLRTSYGIGGYQSNIDTEEFLAGLSYKYSKSLSFETKASKYIEVEKEIIEDEVVRNKTNYYKAAFEVKYSF